VTLDRSSSVADGLINLRVGDLTFVHIQRFVDEVVAVTDEAIIAALRWLHREAQLTVEPSGAATTAAVTLGLGAPAGTVAAIVSGGNVQPEQFAAYVGAPTSSEDARHS
jgi:threonine dehydratase